LRGTAHTLFGPAFDNSSSLRYKRTVNSNRAAVRDAFNLHASTYDARFAFSESGHAMRRTVWEAADKVLPAAAHILDLGCGTGEDAIHFAQRGHHVTAIDIASEMVQMLISKARAAGVEQRITAGVSDLESVSPAAEEFDAIFSNFGAINCLKDLSALQRLASSAVKSGGYLILVSMGGFYPLETMAFLAKGQIRRAFRRFGSARSATIEGRQFPVWYHSPATLRRALGLDFSLMHVAGLRSFLPAPGMEHLTRYLPLRLFTQLDALLTQSRLTASCADHYLSVWRRSKR
jgi:ubiquinone/menaquinone biosynthesis C-methylase UbiE